MKRLQIELFGKFRLKYLGETVADVNYPRIQELFSYLLLHHDTPLLRRNLSFLFWPDNSEKQARTNLRNLFYKLRKALPEADQYLLADNKTLQWNIKTSCYFDAIEFEKAIKLAHKAKIKGEVLQQKSSLVQAEKLYKGDLFEDCYKKWIDPERQRLKEQYQEVLQRLIELTEVERAYDDAVIYANKFIERDEFNEKGYRKLMELYTLNKDRPKALQTYLTFSALLKKELGTVPSPKTKNLYDRLKSAGGATGDSARLSQRQPKTTWNLVGRRKEWKKILDCWKGVLSTNTLHFVALKGESGIGKSRIGNEIQFYLSSQGYPVVKTRSYGSAGTVSYGLVTDCLRENPFFERIKDMDSVWQQELVRLLPELKSAYPGLPEPESKMEPWQKKRFLEAITMPFIKNNKPKLLFLDDLQWCDGASLEWLDYLFHHSESSPILIVGAIRTGEAVENQSLQNFISNLRLKENVTEIHLNNFNKKETMNLAKQVAGQEVNYHLETLLFKETEGHPLFVVEYLRQGQQRDKKVSNKKEKAALEFARLPEKINQVITRRFHYLSNTARELMELAATIGRNFSYDILHESGGLQESELVKRLDELISHQVICERDDHYDFTHDKLREVAYDGLNKARKRLYHRQTARAIEKRISENEEGYYSLLGFHYEHGGDREQAINYYEKAARKARNLFSDQDIIFYKRALKLQEQLPANENRDRREQDLLMKLGISLTHFKGYAIEDVVKTCERLKHLSDRLNEPNSVPVLFTLAFGKLVMGHHAKAKQLADKIDTIVNRMDDSKLLVESNYLLALVSFVTGNISKSLAYLHRGLNSYGQNQSSFHIEHFGLEMGVMLYGGLSVTLLLQNKIAESDESLNKAYAIDQSLNHSFSTFHLQYFSTMIWQVKGNVPETKRSAEQFIVRDSDRKFTYWHHYCEVFFGWAHARQKNYKKGLKWIQKGISGLEDQGIIWNRGYCYSLYAEALAAKGDRKQAISSIEEGFRLLQKTQEGWYKAKAYYIKGKILEKKEPKNLEKAKSAFNKALKLAHQQGAKLFENQVRDALEQLG